MLLQVLPSIRNLNVTSFTQLLLDLVPCVTAILCFCLISRTFCSTLSYLIFIFFLWSVITALHLLGTVHFPFVPTFEGQNRTHHKRQPWLLLLRCTKLHSQIWNQGPSTHTKILILKKHFTRLSITSGAYFHRLVFYLPWFLFKSCKTSSHFKICFSIAFGYSGELSSWSGCVIYVVMLLFTSGRCNSLSFSLSASSVFFLIPRHLFPVIITLHTE